MGSNCPSNAKTDRRLRSCLNLDKTLLDTKDKFKSVKQCLSPVVLQGEMTKLNPKSPLTNPDRRQKTRHGLGLWHDFLGKNHVFFLHCVMFDFFVGKNRRFFLLCSHVPSEKRTKLEATGERGIFVGYDEVLKAYCIYLPTQRKVAVRREVRFEEERAFRRS